MIYLVSNSIEPWLIYIWEQFAQINNLESEYKFFTYEQFKETSEHNRRYLLIEYFTHQKIPQSLFIPRRNHFTTDDYIWIRNDFPIYTNTFDEKLKEFDIFFNAFVHLSRLEEWLSEKKGRRIFSYAFRHPRKDPRIWTIPVVNHLFNKLEERIKEKQPAIQFGAKEKPVIQFSHDVDYIRKTIQLRVKNSSYIFFNSARLFFQHKTKESWSKFKKGIEVTIGNASYWFFDSWCELENKLEIHSVYYFYSKAKSSQPRNAIRWILDPSYDLKKDKALIDKCRELISSGYEIGLHGSYFSAGDESLFSEEKYTLEKTINYPVNKSRQHWFNYIESITPGIHEKTGIITDSSLGYNDIEGFRSGIASIYNPYDHSRQKAFSFNEIPTVVMDAHIGDHADYTDCFDWLFKCFDVVKKFAVSVDWHQRGASPEYGWFDSYEKLCREYVSKVKY